MTEYLKVTKPRMWVILASAMLLLIAMLIWASVGTLENRAGIRAIVKSNEAQIVSPDGHDLAPGMKLIIQGQETSILSLSYDEFNRPLACASLTLPDGAYDGTVILGSTRPMDFLLGSR